MAALSGCAREESLYLDWLAGHNETKPLLERNSFDAQEIVDLPDSRGFVPFVVTTDSGQPVVWMEHRRGRLGLTIFAPGPRELVVEAAPYGASVAFELFLDGERLDRLEWESANVARVWLPADRLLVGSHEIEIRLDNSVPPSHELPGTGGLRAFGFAVYRVALEPESQASTRVRERWVPSAPGSTLRLSGRASAAGAKLWLLRDTASGMREILREAALGASESFDWEFDVAGSPDGLERFAVVESGEIGWSALGQSIPAAAVPARRNVLLITLDTTRRDGLGSYRDLDGSALLGDEPTPTPRLDALAGESLLCRRAFTAAPVTAPTHASILLSQPLAEHGLRVNGLPLPPSTPQSLVARLHAWGYRTGAFVSLGVLASDAGFAQDFDHFDDTLNAGWWRYGADLNEALFQWLEEEAEGNAGPRFLWLHYSDPHKPYAVRGEDGYGVEILWDGQVVGEISSVGRKLQIPVELAPGEYRLGLNAMEAAREAMDPSGDFYRISDLKFRNTRVLCEPLRGVDSDGLMGESAEYRVSVPDGVSGQVILTIELEDLAPAQEIRRRYVQELAAADASVAAALDRLRELGWLEDAVIAVVADHGEDLGAEDGRFGHVEHLRPTLSGIGMFVHDPRRMGALLEDPVGVADLAPTLLGAVGVAPGVASFGRDLFEPQFVQRPLYLETFPPEAERHWRSLVLDGHKLDGIVDASGALDGELQLFDLNADLACEQDLLAGRNSPADLSTERWERLLEAWTAWVGEAGEIPEIDPAMRERLRALGYVE